MKIEKARLILMLLLVSAAIVGQKTSPHFNPNFYEPY